VMSAVVFALPWCPLLLRRGRLLYNNSRRHWRFSSKDNRNLVQYVALALATHRKMYLLT
jgi:hypothetical protein